MASNSQLLALVDRLRHMPPEKVEAVLKRLPADEKVVILELLEELGLRKKRQMATEKFMEFVHAVWPNFIEGRHHIRIANLFEQVARGELKRLIINLPPRHTKSEFASYLFPAWFLGKFPHKKIIQASHTAELAVGFGRKVRNLVDSETYQTIFPQVKLQSDSKAAGRWNTNFSGDYFAVGVGGAVAGKGADLCLAKESICIIDDSIGTREKQIQYVNIGDLIKTANGWEKVTRKKLTIHDRYVRINGDICASRGHRFLTTDGWKEARDLRIGDHILTNSIWRRLWVLLEKIFRRKNQPEKLGKV